MTQVTKRGSDTWEVNRFTDLWKGAHECELIGRIVREKDGLYYIDFPVWKATGCEWDRQPHGYLLLVGALRVIDKYEKVLS